MAGIYVHIPFCRKACTYCDFHFSTNLSRKGDLAQAIALEAELRKGFFPDSSPLDTLYFGGGTPSLLDHEELRVVLDALHRHFSFRQDFEFTLECNPDDLDERVLGMLSEAGVNRLSIGVQSFREPDLKLMNRSHDAGQARESIELARKMGFDNLTVDLIYGIPGLSDGEWKENVRTLIEMGAPHVSAYALTVEEKTVLERQVEKGAVEMPSDEVYQGQYLALVELLEAAGYEHYELSNFALPGWRSRHNSSYWFGEPYLGLGPSAHSFQGTNRSWNVANNARYLKAVEKGELPVEEEEKLTEKERGNEYLLTRMRLREGLKLEVFQKAFGRDLMGENGKYILKQVDEGNAEMENGWLRLTPKGLLLSNAIIGELFSD